MGLGFDLWALLNSDKLNLVRWDCGLADPFHGSEGCSRTTSHPYHGQGPNSKSAEAEMQTANLCAHCPAEYTEAEKQERTSPAETGGLVAQGGCSCPLGKTPVGAGLQ